MGSCCCCCREQRPLADSAPSPEGNESGSQPEPTTEPGEGSDHQQAQELANAFASAGVDAEFALSVLRDHAGDSQQAWTYLLRYQAQTKIAAYERYSRPAVWST